MNEPVVLVRVVVDDEGTVRVLSPGVGWWSDPPRPGALVGPGTPVGRFATLNRRYRLVIPDGPCGRIVGSPPKDRSVAVEYGEPLFEMAPVEAESAVVDGAALGHPAGEDIPAGARAVVSPTDGYFYRRSAPDADPFVEAGSRIRSGQPVGLVEVMKTFNQILYGGPGFPDEAEVLEIRAEDAEEVHAGQVLLVVR